MVEDDSRTTNGNGTAKGTGLGANATDGEWSLFGGNVMAPRVRWSSEVFLDQKHAGKE